MVEKIHERSEEQGQSPENPLKDDGPGSQQPESNQQSREDKRSFFEKHRKAKPILVVAVIVVVIGGGIWYWHHRQWESTDDAQVDGYVYGISARISGHVVRVMVNDGDHVESGQLLVEIDPADYQVAFDRAQAAYQNAQAGLLSAELGVPVSSVGSRAQISTAEADVLNAEAGVSGAQQQQANAQQQLAEAQANARKANTDLTRYKQLVDKREISQQQYDQAVASAESQNAIVAARAAAAKGAEDQVAEARGRQTQAAAGLQNARITPKQVASTEARAKAAQAEVDMARAALQQAQLNLNYTKIIAPVEGIVGPRTVTAGQNVQPGEDLMSLVPLHDVWITANFRETQLWHVRPGQEVKIRVDTYGRDWKGHVTSVGGATGARFSLLPPENATGNYVKVVQRISVRIDLDNGNQEGMLRPGMSVEPNVRIR